MIIRFRREFAGDIFKRWLLAESGLNPRISQPRKEHVVLSLSASFNSLLINVSLTFDVDSKHSAVRNMRVLLFPQSVQLQIIYFIL